MALVLSFFFIIQKSLVFILIPKFFNNSSILLPCLLSKKKENKNCQKKNNGFSSSQETIFCYEIAILNDLSYHVISRLSKRLNSKKGENQMHIDDVLHASCSWRVLKRLTAIDRNLAVEKRINGLKKSR